MAGNSFGQLFRITTFGESHGEAIGVIIDGCPAGLPVDLDYIQGELDKRKPGQSKITTQRKEADTVKILSGTFEGKTTGTPIAMVIPNEDQRSKDYGHNVDVFRPSHADYTYQTKYGIRDHRGGGRSSARETAARVAAGALAKLLLKTQGIEIIAHVSSVGKIEAPNVSINNADEFIAEREKNIVRCADPATATEMIDFIDSVRKNGDTVGGKVSCYVKNCPVGLGEPVFDKLHADLGKAMLSINAVHGFEFGSGFSGSGMLGSEHNDVFIKNADGSVTTRTNYSGGIQGGISNGMPIEFKVAFKPVATIMHNQQTIDSQGNEAEISGKGRHDPCVVPRAVPIVEAMAALVLADHWLRNRNAKL
ncbi:chorismate synthase [Mucilaginibacter pallidiroseus]|uniref:Chorismate synthase n=1 Tax=Mucilaginibacter pallidiroseus TaxID=2599295 RepID=A0A563U0I9_9SPHI|nr:chorismate synthase [Mucilaginibacter pallidiroseus]TWR25136.1 chorismate synthase [Mucilaginibacter pallidiroseus]